MVGWGSGSVGPFLESGASLALEWAGDWCSWESARAAGVDLVLGQAGSGIHREVGCLLHSLSPMGMVPFCCTGLPGKGMMGVM